jgi:hypothetical protein
MYKIKISTNVKKCTHNPHINIHSSQKGFALFDNQTGIVNTIMCRQNKRKQNNQGKAMYQGNKVPIPDHQEGRSKGGKRFEKKEFSTKYRSFLLYPHRKTRTK